MTRGRKYWGYRGCIRKESRGLLKKGVSPTGERNKKKKFLPKIRMGSISDTPCGCFWGFASSSDKSMDVLKEIRKTLFIALFSWKSVLQFQMQLLATIMFSYLCTLNNECF